LTRIFLTQLAIKCPPYPTFVSELRREIRSSKICAEINRKPEKNIPDIIDRNMKKDQQILIIF